MPRDGWSQTCAMEALDGALAPAHRGVHPERRCPTVVRGTRATRRQTDAAKAAPSREARSGSPFQGAANANDGSSRHSPAILTDRLRNAWD